MFAKLSKNDVRDANKIIEFWSNRKDVHTLDYPRYEFEKDMFGVNEFYFREPQYAEMYLKDFAESTETDKYYNLFFKLYGDMQKYADFFK